MTTPDTTDLSIVPFHQWNPFSGGTLFDEPNAGIAVGDTFSLYFLPDSTVAVEPVVRPSLFVGHGFAVNNGQMYERAETVAPVWVFAVLVALTALTALFFHTSKLHFKDLPSLLFDSRAMDRTLRNNNLNSRIRLVPMGLLMLAGLMLPVHQMALAQTGIVGYLLLTAAVSALYLLRNGLMRLLAGVFENSAAVDFYIASNYFYHLMLGTLLLPLLFLFTYLSIGHEVLLYILSALVLLELVVRLFRGLKLFLTQSSGPYVYLFYYLCIVELTPILVLINWFIE